MRDTVCKAVFMEGIPPAEQRLKQGKLEAEA